jgi:hypothetical protein|tara:strand:+ start:469 stop:741 length:273 start_codon:yes stop_codon:yes gene_type:complete
VLWKILFGLLFLGTNRYGDYITDECPQAGYSCPKICDVDHIHLPKKECKDAKRKRNIWEAGRKTSKEKETDSQKEVLTGECNNGKDKKSR